MTTHATSTLLDGLSVDDLVSLARLTNRALSVDLGRRSIEASRALAAGDPTILDMAAAKLDGDSAALDAALGEAPQLAKPLQAIRELANKVGDPESEASLQETVKQLATAAAEQDPEAAKRLTELAAVAPPLQASAKAAAKESAAEGPKPPPFLPNEIEGEGLAAAMSARPDPKAVPDRVASRYTVKGKEFRTLQGTQVAFVDHGSRLQTNKSFDGYAVQSMVDIADARGWASIKVSGDETFRRAVWMEAASRGIAVSGYKPSEAERQAAESRAARNGRLNRIEENPAVQKFLGAKDSQGRMEAASAHPELKRAFALEAALAKFAEQRLQPGDRESFVARQRENIASDLASGKDLPAIALRDRQLQRRDRQRDLEQER